MYPDALVASILASETDPDQIVDEARWLRNIPI